MKIIKSERERLKMERTKFSSGEFGEKREARVEHQRERTTKSHVKTHPRHIITSHLYLCVLVNFTTGFASLRRGSGSADIACRFDL